MFRLGKRRFIHDKFIRIRADLSVFQVDDPGSIFLRQFRIVGDHHDEPVSRHFLQKFHDLNTRLAVQRPGRLIGKQNIRIVDKRPGDRHPLHLSAGHLVRFLVELASEPYLFQRLDRALPPLTFPDARDRQRQFHICQNGLVWDQVVTLKDKSNRMVPVGIPVSVFVFFCRNAVDDQVSAVIAIQSSDDIQKRRLSRAAWSQNRHKLVVAQIQTDVIQRFLHQIPGSVLFAYMLNL